MKRRLLRWSLLTGGLLGLVASQLVSGRSALADSGSVDAGSAIASASVLGAVPIVGNTNLAVTAGDASASYQESEATSSSSTLDLGGVGVILANTIICGQVALPSDEQPPPLTDDSDGGPPSATNGLTGAAAEAVTAVSSPESASATTTPVGQDIAGLLTVGGQATSAVSYVSGSEREAQSSVSLSLDIANGLVDLTGLTWKAEQHSGTTAVSQGTFSVGSITVGTLSVPAPSPSVLASVVALANQVLTTLGLTLILPSVTTDSVTGTVTVTPLQITVGKSALSDAVISPLISQVSALEAAVNGQTQSGSDCSSLPVLESNLAQPTETVANVALGAFSNGGGFDLDLGGVTADTLPPPAYADPFGSGGSGVGGGALPPSSLGSFGSGLPVSSPPTSSAPTGASTTTTPGQASASPPASLSSAAHCETTSPSGAPGCWSGDAAVVGAVAVAAGGLLFLADFRKSRRSRRQKTEEAMA